MVSKDIGIYNTCRHSDEYIYPIANVLSFNDYFCLYVTSLISRS